MPTQWTGRPGILNDRGYLITQSGVLCDNNGNAIIFHTGIFSKQPTQWTGRKPI